MNKKTILLIEDNKGIQECLSFVMEEAGYSLTIAWNGQEALNLLRKAPLPSLIILDVMLPILNGLELREIMKEDVYLKNIPIIILTAKIGIEKTLQLYSNECFIAKPFDLPKLLYAVEQFCNE